MALSWWQHFLMTWLQIALGFGFLAIFVLALWKVADWINSIHRQNEARKTKWKDDGMESE